METASYRCHYLPGSAAGHFDRAAVCGACQLYRASRGMTAAWLSDKIPKVVIGRSYAYFASILIFGKKNECSHEFPHVQLFHKRSTGGTNTDKKRLEQLRILNSQQQLKRTTTTGWTQETHSNSIIVMVNMFLASLLRRARPWMCKKLQTLQHKR